MERTTSSTVPPPPQWVLDLNSTAPPRPKNSSLPDPPGYTSSGRSGSKSKQTTTTVTRKAASSDEMDKLKLKKAWELAIAPAKQLPMSAFGMYMTGNTLQIFSIFMVFTLFKTPVTAIMGMQNVFARFETESTKSNMVAVKFVYILTNLLGLALGVWKVNAMGLLPTTRSDWLAWESAREYPYRAYPGGSLRFT